MNVVEKLLYNITLEQLMDHIQGLESCPDEAVLYKHGDEELWLKLEDAKLVAAQIFRARDDDGTYEANCYPG